MLVYNDLNSSKSREFGEPLLTGAVITVTNSAGVVVGTWTTDGTEPHCFQLPQGNYTVVEQNPPGYVSTTPDIVASFVVAGYMTPVDFGDQIPSAPSPTPTATPTTYQPQGALCVLVYNDLNGSKSREFGEPLLTGAVITVKNSLGVVVGTWTTDGTEPYCFLQLPVGNYMVTEQNPPGYVSTTPDIITVPILAGYVTPVQFGDQMTVIPTSTPTVTPTSYQPQGVLCVLVYNDLANYGIRDVGEPPLPGALITVMNSMGVVVATWTTDGTEPHCFQLPPGNYMVTEQNPPGYVSTTPDNVTVPILAGYSTFVEFGDRVSLEPTPTPTSTPTRTSTPTPTAPPNLGTLCLLVYNDLNSNASRDDGEPLLTGAMITVTNSAGVVVATWTTNGTEPRCFQLPPGDYTVTEKNPPGYISTTPDTVTVVISSLFPIQVDFGDTLIPPSTCTPQANVVQVPVIQARDGWETLVQVQNVGQGPGKFALLLYGYSGPYCGSKCIGPKTVELSGLVPMGAAWSFELGANTVDCNGVLFSPQSGIVVSLSEAQWRAVESMNCWEAMHYVDGLWKPPAVRAAGQPAAVSVNRLQLGSGGTPLAAAYTGISDAMDPGPDPYTGAYMYYAPAVLDKYCNHGWSSRIWIQNSGSQCTSVEIWFYKQDDCLRARVKQILALCPGETIYVEPEIYYFMGSAWIRASQPLGVVVDAYTADGKTLNSYRAMPTDYYGSPAPAGSLFNYAPLVYKEFYGWSSIVSAQNLSGAHNAFVKVYFLDNSGDVITTMTDWICPRGSQAFDLQLLSNLPGQYVGQVRVESQNWWGSGAPPVDAPYIQSAVNLVNYNTKQVAAYNALPRPKDLPLSVRWVALPFLAKDKYDAYQPSGVTWSSELVLTNLDARSGVSTYRIDFFDQNGLQYSLCRTLNEKQVDYIQLADLGVFPSGWVGSALISWQCSLPSNIGALGVVVLERPSDYDTSDVTKSYEGIPLLCEPYDAGADACPGCGG